MGSVNAPVPNSEPGLLRIDGHPAGRRPQEVYRTQPLLLWLAAALALACVGAAGGLWRRSGTGPPMRCLGLAAVGAVGSAISSVLIIQTVPFEVAQESLGRSHLLLTSAAHHLGGARPRSGGAPRAGPGPSAATSARWRVD